MVVFPGHNAFTQIYRFICADLIPGKTANNFTDARRNEANWRVSID